MIPCVRTHGFIVATGLFLTACQAGSDKMQTGRIAVAPPSEESAGRDITTDDLLYLIDIDTIAVSPDRSKAAFQLRQADLEASDYKNEWYSLSLDGVSAPRFMGDAGAPRNFHPVGGDPSGWIHQPTAQWAPDSSAFAYETIVDDVTQIGVSFVEKGAQTILTSGAASSHLPRWSPDNRDVFYRKDAETKAEREAELTAEGERGFLYDYRFVALASDKPFLEKEVSPVNFQLEVNRDSDFAYAASNVRTGESRRLGGGHLARMHSQAAQNTPHQLAQTLGLSDYIVSQAKSEVDYRVARPVLFGPGDQYMAWAEKQHLDDASRYPELSVFAAMDGADGLRISCPVEEACVGHIHGVYGSADGSRVYFQKQAFDGLEPRRFYRWDLSEGAVEMVHESYAFFEQCQRGPGDALICLYEGPDQPRKIVSLDLNTGALSDVFDPNPVFRTLRLGDAERLTWVTPDGHGNYTYLVKPPNYDPNRQYPLLITTYTARGFLRGAVGDEYPVFPAAAEDMLVLTYNGLWINEEIVDGRPRGRYDDWFEQKANLSSLETIVDMLIADGLVDPERIAMSGNSFGSELAVYNIMYAKHDIAVAVMAGPAWNTLMYDLGSEFYRSLMRHIGLGYPYAGESFELWSHVAAAWNPDKMTAPLLLNVADREMLPGVQLYNAMQDHGKTVEMYVYQDEYHTKIHPKSRDASYRRNIQWLKFWLQNKEETDPVSPEQYNRWRKMRGERCAWDEPEDERPFYCDFAEVN